MRPDRLAVRSVLPQRNRLDALRLRLFLGVSSSLLAIAVCTAITQRLETVAVCGVPVLIVSGILGLRARRNGRAIDEQIKDSQITWPDTQYGPVMVIKGQKTVAIWDLAQWHSRD